MQYGGGEQSLVSPQGHHHRPLVEHDVVYLDNLHVDLANFDSCIVRSRQSPPSSPSGDGAAREAMNAPSRSIMRRTATSAPQRARMTGGVNVWAWQRLTSCVVGKKPCPTPEALAIGRDPSASEVIRAMCWDYFHVSGTNPITRTIGTLASAYYGWAGAAKSAAETWQSQTDCPGAPGYSPSS